MLSSRCCQDESCKPETPQMVLHIYALVVCYHYPNHLRGIAGTMFRPSQPCWKFCTAGLSLKIIALVQFPLFWAVHSMEYMLHNATIQTLNRHCGDTQTATTQHISAAIPTHRLGVCVRERERHAQRERENVGLGRDMDAL